MKNKKFLIILGIAIVVAIGGVMYFKTAANQQASVATSLLGSTVLPDEEWRNLCLDRKPHLEILSPDGGETYLETDTIALKWRSCNLSSEIYVDGRIEGYTEGRTMVEHIDLKFAGSSESNYDLTKNDGQQDFTLAAWDLPVNSTGFKVILETRGTAGSPVASDRSDNLFSILKAGSFSIQPVTTSAIVTKGSGTVDDITTFTYKFKATAGDDDYLIANLCKQTNGTASGYITFDYEATKPVTMKTLGCTVTSSDPSSVRGNFFENLEGETVTITLTVSAQIDMSAGNSALVRMVMKGIPFRKHNELGLEGFWTLLNPNKTAYASMTAR